MSQSKDRNEPDLLGATTDTLQAAGSMIPNGDPGDPVSEGISSGAQSAVNTMLTAAKLGAALSRLLIILFHLSIRSSVLPLEIILRKRIGERYHLPIVVFGAVVIFVIFLKNPGWSNISESASAFLIMWVIVGVMAHKAGAFLGDRFGLYWHSKYEGDSWVRIGPMERLLERWHFTFDFSKLVLEPMAIALIGSLLIGLGSPRLNADGEIIRSTIGFIDGIGYYLIGSVVPLILLQILNYGEQREKLLDEKDAKLEAQMRMEAEQGDLQPGIRSYRGVVIPARKEPKAATAQWKD